MNLATLIATAADAVTAAAPVAPAAAATTPAASGAGGFGAVGMVLVLTAVTLLPAIVLSCTCFVRFVVVLGFVRTGLGTPAAPPNQVLIGLALFMSVFVSAPVATEMYDAGGKAYLAGQITEREAYDKMSPPLRRFLIARASEEDLRLFYEASNEPQPAAADDVPMRIAIPAFVLSELRTAFKIGLTILLPFLVIDLIAATVLSALGMVMVPPQIVALPVKLLVFVAIDGWHLIVESLLRGAVA